MPGPFLCSVRNGILLQRGQNVADPVGLGDEDCASGQLGARWANPGGDNNDGQIGSGLGGQARQGKAIGAVAQFDVGDQGVDIGVEQACSRAGAAGRQGVMAAFGQLIGKVEQQERLVFNDQNAQGGRHLVGLHTRLQG